MDKIAEFFNNLFGSVNPSAFVDNLKYMGKGMLVILIVMAVLIFTTWALNTSAIALSKKKENKNKNQ